jgi:transcriptional regulator GlxA family with amidase domain
MATMIISVLALDQVMGFELMIPGQVFGMANMAAAETGAPVGDPAVPPYEVRVCGQRPSISTTADWGMAEIRTSYGLDALVDADLVVVPGTHQFMEEPDPQVISALRAAADNGARVASMCVGAFTLAAAGLLDGRRATTHWQFAPELAQRYPAVDVDPTVLFVDEGPVLTAAGVASGLDLCLHLIRQHAGPDLAARTARRIVVPAWRDGGQAQYIEHAGPADAGHPLQPTITWMEENAVDALDLRAIANHAAVSVRTLNRQFREHFGTTPLGLLARMRIDRARRLLESTGLTMDRVAEQSGFGSYASLRYHFHRVVGVSPQKYRQAYTAEYS